MNEETNSSRLLTFSKQKLISAPILALPEGEEDFVVYCDASQSGLGSAFIQQYKVIVYASRQFKDSRGQLYNSESRVKCYDFALKL